MNRQQVKELLPIIQAYADGKQIEIKAKEGNIWRTLEENDIQYLDFKKCDFRIKPESKYRPFKNVKECWQEMQKHQPFGWITSKTNIEHLFITCIKDDISEYPFWLRINSTSFDFEQIFDDFTFADGAPFGVKEEGI